MLPSSSAPPATVPVPSEPPTPAPLPRRFVHARGGRIVGPDGEPLQLRGVGLGNWLLPEGYMWGFGDAAASPREIEALLVRLVGDEDAERFWHEFRDRFLTEDDIRLIATLGFDHVRLPINWRVLMAGDGALLEDGFALVDRLVRWCAASGLLVLLDLHGAPGGQTGTNIDDSAGRPELFMDPRNADLTVALWTELARRYRDDPAVLGYDLLNEPLPNEWQHRYPDELVALYRRVTDAIRAVDAEHLLMYEGTHWSTNWEIFTEVWDENSALQFHKYWSSPDRPSIQPFLDIGAALGLPVYMGEGGENTAEWLAAAHQLYDDLGIGWNFWTWKKIDTTTSPLSVVPPAGWAAVLDFVDGRGPQPTPAEARATLDALLDAMAVEACRHRPEITAGLFRRAPVALPAYGFTVRGRGHSYMTVDARPNPSLRADDAVTLRRLDGGPEVSFPHPSSPEAGTLVVADLEPGEWLAWEATVGPGIWEVVVVGSSSDGLAPFVSVDGEQVHLRPWTDGTRRGWSGPLRAHEGELRSFKVTATSGMLTVAGLRIDERLDARSAG